MTTPLLSISELFNGDIWRLEIDTLSGTILVEIRNTTEKQVSFASISLVNGNINFKDLTTPERWFVGIEAAFNGVLLLHNYQSENSPVHKGLTAINVTTGVVLWSNYSYALDHLSVNGPVMYNTQFQPKKLFVGDVKTGIETQRYDPAINVEYLATISLPQILPVAELPLIGLKIEPFGNTLHYLEYNNFRIVSLHLFNAEGLQQHLFILNDAGIVYQDILNTGIQKIQPEAFILHKNCLIYIKNKQELKAINL